MSSLSFSSPAKTHSRWVLLSVFFSISLHAETFRWNPKGEIPVIGGSGDWATIEPNWFHEESDQLVLWPNTSGSQAIFSAPAGIVTLRDAISVSKIIFEATGYCFEGGTNALSLSSPFEVDTGEHEVTFAVALRGGLCKQGSGRLQLNRPIDYSEKTTLQEGALIAGAANVLLGTKTTFDTGLVELKSGTTLELNGFPQTIRRLKGDSSSIITNQGPMTTLKWGQTGNDTFSGVIAGNISIEILDRTQTLSGQNTYTGYTMLSKKQLTLSVDDCLPKTTDLRFQKSSANACYALGSTHQTIAGLTYAGTYPERKEIKGNQNGTLTLESDKTYSFNGTLSGGLSLIKQGTGRQILSGACAHTGETLVRGGILQLDGTLARTELIIDSDGRVEGTGVLTMGVGDSSSEGILLKGELDASQLTLSLSVAPTNSSKSFVLMESLGGTWNGAFKEILGIPEGWRIVDNGSQLCLCEIPAGTLLLFR